MTPNNDDLTSDIVGASTYEDPITPLRKQFKPWHKPRKQFVREKQWRRYIDLLLPLINSRVSQCGRPLSYLGLPGTDLLDIRFFLETVCVPNNLGFRFLGFNTAAQPKSKENSELNVSLDEMRKHRLVDEASDVISDDFRSIGNPNSIAYRCVHNADTFDVVNLDLCDGFAIDPPKVDGTLYKAMNMLVTSQARRSTPWLFLLTTKVARPDIHDEALEMLLERYLRNLSDGEEFRGASAEHLSIGTEAEMRETIQSGKGLADVFLTGLCKWLFGFVVGQAPPCKAKLENIVGYNVGGGETMDLVSLAIRFTPLNLPSPDPGGLSGGSPEPPKECELASRLPGPITNRADVDGLLAEESGLFQEMVNAQAVLLEQARYNTDEYRAWVRGGCKPVTA